MRSRQRAQCRETRQRTIPVRKEVESVEGSRSGVGGGVREKKPNWSVEFIEVNCNRGHKMVLKPTDALTSRGFYIDYPW